jgi:hypothetical protein
MSAGEWMDACQPTDDEEATARRGPAPGVDPRLLEGVWIGISIQSVTVTALGSNQVFAGTFFTPAMDARCIFSGTWNCENDVLALEFTECRPPVFPVPLTDRNRVEWVSSDSVVLHTLPHGPTVQWNRVDFPGRRCTAPSPAAATPPTTESLAALSAADLTDANPLYAWIGDLVAAAPGRSYEEQLDAALRLRIPRKAGYAFAIFQIEGLWGNGGMQHAVLRGTVPQTRQLLGVAAAGYEHFGRPRLAKLIHEIAAHAGRWMRHLDELDHRRAADEEYAPLLAEVDSYDGTFATLLEEEGTAYEAIAADIRAHPHDYLRDASPGIT